MKRLRELREKLGFSQQALADRAHISRTAVAQYESGVRRPTGDILVRLSASLGVSTAYLLEKTDDPQRADHLPPDWEQVVEDAMSSGFSPEDVRRALQMLRLALGKEDPGS